MTATAGINLGACRGGNARAAVTDALQAAIANNPAQAGGACRDIGCQQIAGFSTATTLSDMDVIDGDFCQLGPLAVAVGYKTDEYRIPLKCAKLQHLFLPGTCRAALLLTGQRIQSSPCAGSIFIPGLNHQFINAIAIHVVPKR